MANNQTLYDTSDYPQDHPLYSSANKKVLGKLKDECAGRAIAEFVGLRQKMYSILEAGGKKHHEGEGRKKNVVKKHIRHEQYKETLFEKQTFRYGMDVLRSECHRIYGQHLNKVSLSPFDSKRWISKNGVNTLAYGHRDATPVGCYSSAEMDAYSLAVGQRHLACSTTRARRVWSPSVPAGTHQETTPGQWPAGDNPLVHQAGKGSEHRPPRGLFAL